MERQIKMSESLQVVFFLMQQNVVASRSQYVMPEHLMLIMLRTKEFRRVLDIWEIRPNDLKKELEDYLGQMEKVPDEMDYTPEFSVKMMELLDLSASGVASSGTSEIEMPHCINALLKLEDCFASELLHEAVDPQAIDDDGAEFMATVIDVYGSVDHTFLSDRDIFKQGEGGYEEDDIESGDDMLDDLFDSRDSDQEWRSYVECLNETAERRNPLVGRERELERTMQVLCRREKNNPLHVGEPGVGKTALVYGLARLINEGKVPERLKGSRIYGLDIATMIAGTQFRGDFEKRIKMIMDGIRKEESPIVYIDEIHNLVGAGAVGEGSMDASNILKPYLEGGEIRFIGSTTYEEYNRYFSKSRGMVRRFQQIDIPEPTEAEALEILRRLKENYESYHGVSYTDEALRFAVEGSVRHINGRALPDKAIDVVDEAGAYRQMHPDEGNIVDKHLIARVLSGICRVDVPETDGTEEDNLDSLYERIRGKVFGQDEAVGKVAESVLMSRAGLTEEGKPLASLLFVGPTGVGKTETAKALAEETGVPLIRFDMSEYAEKHSVAKLIGSPAGYVGYDDGGILTDAVRKSPSCVLLLDEIEKAHPDIYDILLQVMDYARLTDNKGRHADFRNVVVIMTSNAGAQYAAQAKVGFASRVTSGEAMLRQVKRQFKPEFLNRLTSTVVFNEMTRDMASLILDKKLRQLREQLQRRGVELVLSESAQEYILNEGFTVEYGARELDRVISSWLKPLLMREILFGGLKKGGKATVSLVNDKLTLTDGIQD